MGGLRKPPRLVQRQVLNSVYDILWNLSSRQLWRVKPFDLVLGTDLKKVSISGKMIDLDHRWTPHNLGPQCANEMDEQFPDVSDWGSEG